VIWDLSLGGWLSTRNVIAATGLEVIVILNMYSAKATFHIVVDGAVIRWIDHDTMGWAITSITDASRAELAAFLEYETERRRQWSFISRVYDGLTELLDHRLTKRPTERVGLQRAVNEASTL
jgi:hypothetical protein